MNRVNKRGEFTLKYYEVQNIINCTDTFKNRCIIKTIYWGGLRVSELVNLKVQHIDFERKVLHIKDSKYNKSRTIPVLNNEFLNDLKHHIGKRDEGYVFDIGIRAVQYMLAKTAIKAGIKHPDPLMKNVNPHLLRHSIARHLKDKGYPIEFVQKFLGHSSFKTTYDSYGTLSLNDMKEIVSRKTGDRTLLGNIKYIPEVIQ